MSDVRSITKLTKVPFWKIQIKNSEKVLANSGNFNHNDNFAILDSNLVKPSP